MFLTRLISAPAFIGRFRGPAGRRALGLALTLLVEALMLILLLTLGTARRPGMKETHTTLMTFQAEEAAAPAPRESRPERRAAERRAPAPPQRTAPPVPRPAPPVAAPVTTVLPMSWQLAPSGARRRPDQTQAPVGPVYGPPAIAGTAEGDSERVGTAPNGEPLYAAQWYEEPSDQMMGAYLSTARGPGWGLIACRTAPDYRVEDCVALDEYPQGSQIARAALAAAWEFRVRPPRRGGRSLIGAWVRIRVEYDMGARRGPY